MNKTKAARGLCCFFKCREQAVIRFITPDGAQLFCWEHWKQNNRITGIGPDPECVLYIVDEHPLTPPTPVPGARPFPDVE